MCLLYIYVQKALLVWENLATFITGKLPLHLNNFIVYKLSEVDVIGASLSEPHTSMTVLCTRLRMFGCLLVDIHID